MVALEKQLASVQGRLKSLEDAHFETQLALREMTERATKAELRCEQLERQLQRLGTSVTPFGGPASSEPEAPAHASTVEEEVSRVRKEIKKTQEDARERSGSRPIDATEEESVLKFERKWLRGATKYQYKDWRVTPMPGRALAIEAPGFHIETGDVVFDALPPPSALELSEPASNTAFYEDFMFNSKHTHFCGYTGLGAFADIPVVISVEQLAHTRGAKLRRKPVLCIVRSPDGMNQVCFLFVASHSSSLTLVLQYCLSGLKEVVCRLPYATVTLSEHMARHYPGQRFTEVTSAEEHAQLSRQLLAYEQMHINQKYKIGVLRWEKGQVRVRDFYYCATSHTPLVQSENEAFANESSPAFRDFMDWLGERVELSGWSKFRGGLNVTDNATGTHSYYTTIERENVEIMFHVSTELPKVLLVCVCVCV